MKGRDLVVVEVGGDEGLGGERLLDLLDKAATDLVGIHPLGIRLEILTHGGHRQPESRFQHIQVVGNIAGAAAEFAAHLGNEK